MTDIQLLDLICFSSLAFLMGMLIGSLKPVKQKKKKVPPVKITKNYLSELIRKEDK